MLMPALLLTAIVLGYAAAYQRAGYMFDRSNIHTTQDDDTYPNARHAYANNIARWSAAATTATVAAVYAVVHTMQS